MNVIISARHCSPPNSIRDRAAERLERLVRYEPRLARAEVRFDIDHGEPRVEARLSVTGSHTVVATGGGETFDDALNATASRLSRQLKRRRERDREHQAIKLSEQHSVIAGGT